MMKLCLILALVFSLSNGEKVEPGFKGRLTLKGLQYAWREMQNRVPSAVHIPDIEGSVSVAVLGRVYYYVSQLQITNLDLSQSNLTFTPDIGITVSIQKGQIQISGHIQIKSVLFSSSAGLRLWIRGLSLNANLGITSDDLGHGAVWDGGCSSNVGQVDLSFNGGYAWIFNMFKGSMIGPVHDTIRKQICPAFSQAVTQMEQKLNNLPVSILVDSVSSVDLDLVTPPLITDKSFDLFVKGQFDGRGQHWDLPFLPESLDLPEVDSRMVLLAVSQFSANSAAYVHYKAGFLQCNITDDMLPKQSPIRLNIFSLGIFAPELPRRFPDSPPIMLQVSALSAPTVNCQPDSLTVQGSAIVEAFVMSPNQPPISIFQIQADCLSKIDLLLSEEAAGARVFVKNFSLSLIRSSVGEVKVENMQKTLNLTLKFLLPLVNERLRKFFPFPPNMPHLQNPVVRVLQGYIVIMTDLQLSQIPQHTEKLPDHNNVVSGL